MQLTFHASKHKLIEDREGEVKLTLTIPLSDALHALRIPTEKVLKVTVDIIEEG